MQQIHTTTFSMDAADYWLMAREYSIWNAAIASLQFWTTDLDPVTLGRATEHVYATFFYSPSSHTLHQQSDEILFGCFVITLNAAFDQQLSLGDEDYESGSYTIDLPTPLRKDSDNPSCFQHGTCFIWSSCCHTMQYTTNSTETSAQMLILQFSRQQHSTQHCRMFRSQRGGLLDGTSGWWTLDFQGNTWKDIMYSWACSATWKMSIPMHLHELSNALLHGQLAFKWYFGLWGLYGHIQQWGHTSLWGYTLLRDVLVWFELY